MESLFIIMIHFLCKYLICRLHAMCTERDMKWFASCVCAWQRDSDLFNQWGLQDERILYIYMYECINSNDMRAKHKHTLIFTPHVSWECTIWQCSDKHAQLTIQTHSLTSTTQKSSQNMSHTSTTTGCKITFLSEVPVWCSVWRYMFVWFASHDG